MNEPDIILFSILAAALLASRSYVFEEVRKVENSLKPNLDIRIKKPKTIQGPIRSFHKMKTIIGLVVNVILSNRQNKLTTRYRLRTMHLFKYLT